MRVIAAQECSWMTKLLLNALASISDTRRRSKTMSDTWRAPPLNRMHFVLLKFGLYLPVRRKGNSIRPAGYPTICILEPRRCCFFCYCCSLRWRKFLRRPWRRRQKWQPRMRRSRGLAMGKRTSRGPSGPRKRSPEDLVAVNTTTKAMRRRKTLRRKPKRPRRRHGRQPERRPTAKQAGDAAKKTSDVIKEGISEAGSRTAEKVAKTREAAMETSEELAGKVKEKASTAKETAEELAGNEKEKAKEATESATEKAKETTEAAWTKAKEKAAKAKEATEETTQAAGKKAREKAAQGGLEAAKEKAKEAVESAKEKLTSVKENVAGGSGPRREEEL